MKNLIRNIFHRLGYGVSRRPYPRTATAEEFRLVREMVAGSTMLPDARLATLFDQVRYCHIAGIQGAIVECGVWKGGAMGLAALALKGVDPQMSRPLHLFDVFDDICAPDPTVDGVQAMKEFRDAPAATQSGRPVPVVGAYSSVGGHGTVDACRDLIERRIGYPQSHVHYHVGWFQDTLPAQAAKVGPVALLRLDGDWYASTKVCLDHLFDLVEPGGFVVIDDYGTYEGCRRAVDEFLENRGLRPYLHRVDAVCYYIQK